MRPIAWLLVLVPVLAAGAVHADDPTPPRAPDALRHYAAGRLLEESGDLSDALAEYYRALSLDPKSVSIIRRASELAARMGDAGRSLELAERGLTLEPRDTRLAWLKGAALFNLGRMPEALEATRGA